MGEPNSSADEIYPFVEAILTLPQLRTIMSFLRIDASARSTRSLSRSLADTFMDTWKELRPQEHCLMRDVGRHPPSFISEEWIAAAFAEKAKTAPTQLLTESNQLIDEVASAQTILMATPMYNYGMPAALKAWFDQVIRIHRTFSFDLRRGDQPLQPILANKTLVLVTSWGEFGFDEGEINHGSDHLRPHIRTLSKYLGVENYHHLGIEYQEFSDQRFENSKEQAHQTAKILANKLALAANSL